MKTLMQIETALSGPSWHGEPGEEEDDGGSSGGSVDWRGVLKAYIALQKNWKYGRCGERWITPPGGCVWRVKIDEEEKTLLSTSRIAS